VPFEEADWNEGYKTDEEVTRLYIEHCENGDMQQLLEELCDLRIESKYGYIPEENIWRILRCLAKAALVLEKGTEDPDAPDDATWPHPIAHFDIKPGNSK
jgi:serine/threonine protein kinase